MQDAQKVRPARPQRAKRRGGTNRTSCGPFAPRMNLGERISSSSTSDLRNALFSVEPLSAARTKLTGFFSILLESPAPNRPMRGMYSPL
jgi:hypothetical protein